MKIIIISLFINDSSHLIYVNLKIDKNFNEFVYFLIIKILQFGAQLSINNFDLKFSGINERKIV